MSKRVRAGLVGCGGMGSEHLKILARRADVQIIGVCDERPERADQVAAQYGALAFSNYTEFVRDAGLDVIHICSPSGHHGDHGLLAAEQGIHVLSEKPLDVDLEKVDRLIARCDKMGVRLGCIFQKRMSPAMQAVHAAIDAGKMGKLISCSISV